jgi:hypothetical protein
MLDRTHIWGGIVWNPDGANAFIGSLRQRRFPTAVRQGRDAGRRAQSWGRAAFERFTNTATTGGNVPAQYTYSNVRARDDAEPRRALGRGRLEDARSDSFLGG